MRTLILDICCLALLAWMLYHGMVWAVLTSADVIDAVVAVVF